MSVASGPLLTIGIPVYNGADTLERCLESVLTYAPEDAQIVISDNCSNDGTERICRQFAKRASNIRYFRQEQNRGSTANFRFVLEQAGTPYFMWLADDDWLGDDFLERALQFLEEHLDYALASPASAYYDSAGAYQFATLPTSIEDGDPQRRVEAFLENLTDNSEFYGVYRRAAARFDAPDVMGSDWISMIDTAFAGKIRILEHALIHRHNRWDSAERHAALAKSAGWPAAQAAQPHYTSALAALLHVALGAPAYAHLRDDERARLALLVFRQFKKNHQLPAEYFFWQDSRRLFGEEFTSSNGHRLRGMLAQLCIEALNAPHGAAPVDQEVLELAMMLRLGTEPMTAAERESFEASRALLDSRSSALAAYAYHALFVPAYKQPRFFGFPEIPCALVAEYARYITALEMLFDSEQDIEAFTGHLSKVIDSAMPDGELASGGPLRISPHWIRSLDAITTNLCMIPCYFGDGTLRDLMEKRARMCATWLGCIGVPTEAAANGGAARPRLRVGMVMQALSSPTDTYTGLPAIAELDRSKFETVLFAVRLQHGSDRLTEKEQYAMGLADRTIALGADLNAMVSAIRSENLDFLIFASNLTAACSAPFILSVCRLAKWQIAFNPCCVTSGSDKVDYFVSSTLLEERGAGQEAYREQLLQISGPGHVRVVPPFEAQTAAAKRAAPRNDREIRLVSGANYFKLTPATRRTWMRVLAALPEASLHLYPFGEAWSSQYDRARLTRVLKREALEAGAQFERIRMLEAFPDIDAIHRFLGTMDIYLDSFPFSGINSVLDPLLSGIPVVTLAGNGFRSNMGASVLHEIGFRECIAANTDDYVSIVRNLAADRTALERAKQRVFETMRRGTRFHDVKWFSGEFGRLMQEIAAGRV
jgi:glycosyltransferase involved in cell wall biosynthesis